MSSVSIDPSERRCEQEEWARLIPGWAPERSRNAKNRSHRLTPFVVDRVAERQADDAENSIANWWRIFVPGPLESALGWKWLCWVTGDFALVILNWLLLGALFVPLHLFFPQVRVFGYGAGAPLFLVGLGILQGAFITLLAYTEGFHARAQGGHIQKWILAKAVLWTTVLLSLVLGLQGNPWTNIGLLFGMGVLHFCSLWMWGRRSEERRRNSAARVRNVLIVGAGATGKRVARTIEDDPAETRKVCGFLDDDRTLGSEVVGRVSELAAVARKSFVDEVILAGPRESRLTTWVLEEAQRLRLDVEIVPELFGCEPTTCEVDRLGEMPIIRLHAERLPEVGLLLKRMVDVIGASVVLALLSPLMAMIALLIKADSEGPVLYCAERAGRKGKLFRCYKFRTMVCDAERRKEQLRGNNQRSGPFFKITGDPRITRTGRILRAYSLDELPQLWNVLKGEMSLVGPRPHPLDDVAGYEMEHLARLDVTPGITGLWQVTARRDPSFERGIALDREYIRTWSLRSDFRILLKTARAVVQGSGE